MTKMQSKMKNVRVIKTKRLKTSSERMDQYLSKLFEFSSSWKQK